MSEENANGSAKPIEIDVTDEHAFRAGVVQHLQFICDRTACIPNMKKKVDQHDAIVKIGRWAAPPILVLFHAAVKQALIKIGW